MKVPTVKQYQDVGAIGKAIYEYTGVVPPVYKSKGERYVEID